MPLGFDMSIEQRSSSSHVSRTACLPQCGCRGGRDHASAMRRLNARVGFLMYPELESYAMVSSSWMFVMAVVVVIAPEGFY